jgi:ribonuclease E
MGSKMLIDAAHPEETRVVVVRGNNRIEELDYEASARKRLRGNIYLAKVTRVEPSLQAAFVDYGGNRHGFLAFNEIHPDYYQIPIADRQALLAEEAEEEVDDEDDRDAQDASADTNDDADDSDDADSPDDGDEADETAEELDASPDTDDDDTGDERDNGKGKSKRNGSVESLGAGDALEDVPRRASQRKRSYKIQEVIKRRQIILVQVVKEERGNKGAALTTYLSLAGRYCVLMPNTARGGGISRKITDAPDRKRLKDVAKSIEVPEGMGLIVRTAGASRTKAEIKRDFDYLIRLWENVRDLTLQSTAPCLVYEEGSLIKRAIRDLYTKDMDTILVEGEEGYKEAKDFMRMLMPSHARHVKSYKNGQPLFMKYSIENQLDVLYSPRVTLPSGGYIIMNQTEALVAIDVNSGKATREHNIEDTALRTNSEAADEVARQMRLRDLAGLVVIDFIDMEERRNNRSVERRLKERLKSDRARIQVGRISHFGLLEMSRQRMRSGVLESSTRTCPTCDGLGFVRSVPSAALQVLRGIEEYLQKGAKETLVVKAPRDVVLYILNEKRDHLLLIETSYGLAVFVETNDTLRDSEFVIERAPDRGRERFAVRDTVQIDSPFLEDESEGDEAGDGDDNRDVVASSENLEEDGTKRRKRRRRRGRRGSRRTQSDDGVVAAESGAAENTGQESKQDDGDGEATSEPTAEAAERPKRGRGSRRRGGRSAAAAAEATDEAPSEEAAREEAPAEAVEAADEEPAPKRSRRRRTTAATVEANADAENDAAPAEKKPARRRRKKADVDVVAADAESNEAAPSEATSDDATAPEVTAEPEQPTEPAETDAVANGNGDIEGSVEAAEPEAADVVVETPPAEADAEELQVEPLAAAAPPKPTRRGWWQRRL